MAPNPSPLYCQRRSHSPSSTATRLNPPNPQRRLVLSNYPMPTAPATRNTASNSWPTPNPANPKAPPPSPSLMPPRPRPRAPKPAPSTPTKPAMTRRRRRWLRWACCGLALAAALAAVVMLALSLTVLKVRDPTLSMDSVSVRWFNVRFDARAARPLRINVTLAGGIVIRNPNYESMRFGASDTEIFVDGVDGPVIGVGTAPPGEVPARGASRVTAGLEVFVDRVGPAVVGEVLFGSGEVRLASRTAVDGRISVLGGLYGRRTVRLAMRCRVALRVSAAAVVVAGNPACVADFGR